MARGSKRLTARQVETAKRPPEGSLPAVYADGDGLRLLVTDKGVKRWELLLRVAGKRRKLGLGVYPGVTLEQARLRTEEHRRAVKVGQPLASQREAIQLGREVKRAAPEVHTVESAFKAFWPTRRARLKNPKHVQQWENSLATYAWPKLGKRPVADVRTAEVMDALALIWHSKPETASRVLQRLSLIFAFAISNDWRERANPCDRATEFLGAARKGERERGNHASMHWRDVPKFIADLRGRQGLASSRLCFEFLILTAARSGEARGARWSEIDLDAKLWTIPAERMKAGREHRVPLSTRAIEIIEEARALHPASAILFPGVEGQVLSDMTLTKRLRDMGLGKTVTAHGFRSSFKTWAAENSVDDLVSEAALAHADANKVRAAYQRSDFIDERRHIMQRWSKYCVSFVSNTIHIRHSLSG